MLVHTLRKVTRQAGICESTPIHVTETGWPTGADRDELRQARTVKTVAEAVARAAEVSVYEFFSLRDPITDGKWRNGFGLLRDDYTPKPAFDTFRQLIAGTGAAGNAPDSDG